MQHKLGINCQITAFQVAQPPADPVRGSHEWLAIATAHVYNSDPGSKGVLTPETAVLAGAVLESVHGRASACTQGDAMRSALDALLFQLKAKGFMK